MGRGPGHYLINEHQSSFTFIQAVGIRSSSGRYVWKEKEEIEPILKGINLSVYWFCS